MAYEILRCPGCEFENHPSCRFCIGCGAGLEEVAPDVVEPESVAELEPEGEAPADARELLKTIVDGAGFEAEESKSGYKVRVPLDGGRSQKVHVMFSGKDDDGEDVVSFLSLAAPATSSHAMAMLRLNARFTYAKVAVVTIGGKEVYGVLGNQLASTADEAEVKKILLDVARRADALEEKLMAGKDSF